MTLEPTVSIDGGVENQKIHKNETKEDGACGGRKKGLKDEDQVKLHIMDFREGGELKSVDSEAIGIAVFSDGNANERFCALRKRKKADMMNASGSTDYISVNFF